jgi:hypothetical protein
MYKYGIVADLTSKTDLYSVESISKHTETITMMRKESKELYFLENDEPIGPRNTVETANSALVRFRLEPIHEANPNNFISSSSQRPILNSNRIDLFSKDNSIIEKTNFFLDRQDLQRLYSQAYYINNKNRGQKRSLEDDSKNFYFEVDFENCMYHVRYSKF